MIEIVIVIENVIQDPNGGDAWMSESRVQIRRNRHIAPVFAGFLLQEAGLRAPRKASAKGGTE